MERLSIPSLAKRIPDEHSAYQFLEELRWGDEPVCPHCGSLTVGYLTPKNGTTRATRTGSESPRRVWKCKNRECRKQFSALTGTIFHGSKIPVRAWLFVLFEMCASKNGVSAREVQRKYDLTPKTAWFMTMRIREAMKRDPRTTKPLLGTIVADEAWVGGKPRRKHGTLSADKPEKIVPPKAIVFTLIDRESGEARSRVIPNVTSDTLYSAIAHQVDVDRSRLMTDDWKGYDRIGQFFAHGHDTVYHSGAEYVRGDVTQPGGELLLATQAEPRRHAPPDQRSPPRPLPRRIRLPVLDPQAVGHAAHGAAHGPDRRTTAVLPSAHRAVAPYSRAHAKAAAPKSQRHVQGRDR